MRVDMLQIRSSQRGCRSDHLMVHGGRSTVVSCMVLHTPFEFDLPIDRANSHEKTNEREVEESKDRKAPSWEVGGNFCIDSSHRCTSNVYNVAEPVHQDEQLATACEVEQVKHDPTEETEELHCRPEGPSQVELVDAQEPKDQRKQPSNHLTLLLHVALWPCPAHHICKRILASRYYSCQTVNRSR